MVIADSGLRSRRYHPCPSGYNRSNRWSPTLRALASSVWVGFKAAYDHRRLCFGGFRPNGTRSGYIRNYAVPVRLGGWLSADEREVKVSIFQGPFRRYTVRMTKFVEVPFTESEQGRPPKLRVTTQESCSRFKTITIEKE